ncbi:uncharacterized protein DUF1566 [Breoghania corrubedonensis]|uniref:Uncharacterized protein DUF1566 n=2 Tax=Breoghania corrubedonensis TaxID=665038 RepID=A0A2T5VAW1_9HYPH|nr:uncharacterized protein DUF1566 [Breoghania corrubedonensis]
MQSRVILIAFLAFIVPFYAHGACVEANNSRFLLHDDEATDLKHGLTWKRCAVGMRWNAEKQNCSGEVLGLGLNEALEYAKKQGNGWRVPTGEELSTLFVEKCEGPWIDTTVFPDVAASDFGEGAAFWTSTEAIPDTFYFFDFTNGYVDMHSRGFHLSVFLVR